MLVLFGIIYIENERKVIDMTMSHKAEMEQLRAQAIEELTQVLAECNDVQRTKSNEVAIPVVGAEGNEYWLVYTIKVPTGADKGREPYDGYAEAEDYAHKLREKAIKAQKKAEAKAKKIEHDEKMRAR